MNFSSAPPLLSIATEKVAILFYNVSEVRELAKIVHFEHLIEEWLQLIHGIASDLLIPIDLHNKLTFEVTRISLRIKDQLKHLDVMHQEVSLSYGIPCQCLEGLLPSICRWTSNTCIDFPKTVEALVQDDRVDLVFRFILSCDYLLDNEVTSLVNIMPEAMLNRLFQTDLLFRVTEFVDKILLQRY